MNKFALVYAMVWIMRVLIVDDEELNRKVLYLMLTRGCGSPEPDFARSSQEAVSMYLRSVTENRPYSLLFLESNVSGFNDCLMLKTMFEQLAEGITTVCMTTFADNYRMDLVNALPDGVVRRYLSKPLDLAELRRIYHDACTAYGAGTPR